MGISDLFTSVFSGGLTGVIGAAITKYGDYKNKELDIEVSREKNAHELLMKQADIQMLEMESEVRVKTAELETDARMDVAESDAFAKSFDEPRLYSNPKKVTVLQSWLLLIVDFTRGMTRPGLTLYLCVLTSIIYFQAQALLGHGFEASQSYEIVQSVINTILYLTTTCILWWFGTRNKSNLLKRK